jgi:hypothetical protein
MKYNVYVTAYIPNAYDLDAEIERFITTVSAGSETEAEIKARQEIEEKLDGKLYEEYEYEIDDISLIGDGREIVGEHSVSASQELSRGIFWVLAETESELTADNIYAVHKYCDMDGNPFDVSDCNSKSGLSYNHEQTWKRLDRKTTKGKAFDYYPRGRVEISHGEATIWLNGNILHLADEIKRLYGLSDLKRIQVKEDGSKHYKSHFDSV